MNVLHLNYLFSIIFLSESATIRKNETLEVLKKDVAQVGSAVENFTFDILHEMLDDEDTESTTVSNEREKRSAEDDVRQLCQNRCREAQITETRQIKELRDEVEKLQKMVKLLQDQQKIVDILDHSRDNSTKETRTEPEESEEMSNGEQLAKMKKDLKAAIENLNQTRELIELQNRKDEILEEELLKQKEEIAKVKSTVDAIFHRNNFHKEEPHNPSARSSEFSSIKHFLKSLPDDEDESDDISSKLHQLQKELSKKRRQQALMQELKQLEKSINEESSGDGDLLKQIIKAIKKSESKGRNDDFEVNNLGDLEEAINRLRPKENDANQFQNILSQLVNKQTNQKPSQITITAQQMNELTKKITANNNNNYPYICIVDDGRVKSGSYRTPPANSRQFYSTPDYSNQRGQQFFPGQFTPPNYYPQGVANGASFEKSGDYQGENGGSNQKYQQDLRQQIDGLQADIETMNRPEYLQKPEDKAVVEDLERQIGDLRNIVNNLNYDGNYQTRSKRSLEDNEVEDSSTEIVAKMNKFVQTLLKESEKPKNELENIQQKIDTIKNQLDTGNPSARAATSQFYPPPLPQLYSNDLTSPSSKEVKSSFKNDFFSEVVGKILDKLISAIPVVIQKLLGFSFDQLSKYDYQDYDIQVLFKNLGIFAYLPVILLRLLRGVSAFLNMLRKNSFFKNFLMPAVILGTVAGSVLFLIWWLQPDDSNSSYNYLAYDTATQNSQNTQNPVSYNYPVYNRSYFNK